MTLLTALGPVRKMYRRLVPERIRGWVRRGLRSAPALGAPYTAEYYSQLDEWQRTSYSVMAESIVRHFHPDWVVDAGCGTGGLLLALKQRGVRRCIGIELSQAARARAKLIGLEIHKGDLSRRCVLDARADLCICIEVAEHLPSSSADAMVENLTTGPRRLLFSGATPGQDGHLHLNEQPPEYWIEKFCAHGYNLDVAITTALRDEWQRAGVAPWYASNIMLFQRRR